MKTKIDCGCEKNVFACRTHAHPQHTPTPWNYDEFTGFITEDSSGDGMVVAHVTAFPGTNATGEFIVKAVNCHEELLAIVKEIYANENDITRRKHSDEMRFRMEEAITKAEAQS